MQKDISRCCKKVQMLQDMARCFKKVVQIKSRFEKPWSGTSREYPLQRDQRFLAEEKDISNEEWCRTTDKIENVTDLT